MTLFPISILLLALASSEDQALDDSELYRRIKNGDHEAYRIFFDAQYAMLFRFLSSKGVSEQTAKDLIQKAFITVWEKRDEIDESKSVRAWLFRIAYTRMLNHIRDHSRFETHAADRRPENRTPADHTQYRELIRAVDAAIDALPEKRRLVFQYCFMNGFTYREAAEALEIRVKTVENHMGLALKDLRQALKKFRNF